ncbi:MAG: hypothetical protein RLZZ46_407, partial [Bacteroidota bacterium]
MTLFTFSKIFYSTIFFRRLMQSLDHLILLPK